MKKLFICLMAIVSASVITSCDKLRELGILSEPTKYFIEMNMTYEPFGLDNTFVSTFTEWYWNPVNGETLEFKIIENYDHSEGITYFHLKRPDIPIPCYIDDVEHYVTISFSLQLQDTALKEDTKYYFGDVADVDVGDGIIASDGRISMWGYTELMNSTSGWIKFTRLELTHDNDEGYADDYEIDLEFEFEVRDPETGEITLKVENGKVFNNPGERKVL